MTDAEPYLTRLTNRLLDGIERLPADVRERHTALPARTRRTPTAGSPGREGGSDLYYTGFALSLARGAAGARPGAVQQGGRLPPHADDRLRGRGRLLLARRELLPRPARRRAGRPRRRARRLARPRRRHARNVPHARRRLRQDSRRAARQHLHELPRRAVPATARPADPAARAARGVRAIAPAAPTAATSKSPP